jgi:hypothetical protein
MKGKSGGRKRKFNSILWLTECGKMGKKTKIVGRMIKLN